MPDMPNIQIERFGNMEPGRWFDTRLFMAWKANLIPFGRFDKQDKPY